MYLIKKTVFDIYHRKISSKSNDIDECEYNNSLEFRIHILMFASSDWDICILLRFLWMRREIVQFDLSLQWFKDNISYTHLFFITNILNTKRYHFLLNEYNTKWLALISLHYIHFSFKFRHFTKTSYNL